MNNSNYVNVAAMMVLERAIHCHDTLLPPSLQDRAAVERWQRILQRFYLPHEGDVVLPFDGASIENCTVHSWSIGNLAYLYPHGLPARINDTVLNATFAVEEKLRTNFSVASSLPCRGAPYFACPPIAGQAALLGQREKAAALLRLAYDNYTLPPWHLLRESRHLLLRWFCAGFALSTPSGGACRGVLGLQLRHVRHTRRLDAHDGLLHARHLHAGRAAKLLRLNGSAVRA